MDKYPLSSIYKYNNMDIYIYINTVYNDGQMDNDGYRIISGFINSLYINIIINSN